MADYDSQSDSNDELVSAYLDDELSLEERARVEQRLAADPAARQMLEQLRSVSQAMRNLPPETVGHDLRAAVLQQLEQSAQTSATYPRAAQIDDSPAAPNNTTASSLPPFSFGRTRRGWFWAGLAVAAALFVAFLLPEEANEDLPDVARRSNVRRDDMRIGGGEMRAADRADASSNEPPPAPSLEALAESRPLRESAEITSPMPAAGVEAAPAEGRPSRGAATEDSLGAADSAGAPAHFVDALPDRYRRPVRDGAAGELGDSFEPMEATAEPDSPLGSRPDESGTVPVDEDLLVVHLNVTPVAFHSKAIDDVLIRNGITVEPAPPDEGAVESASEATASRRAERVVPESTSTIASEESHIDAGYPQNMDLVFVEAAPEQIFACLRTINGDPANYRAVEIEQPPTRDKAATAKNWALEADWDEQFNRGFVPPQQKQQFRQNVDRYFLTGAETAAGRGDTAGTEIEAKEWTLRYRDHAQKLGRAVRVQSPQEDVRLYPGFQRGRSSISGGKTDSQVETLGKLRRIAKSAPSKSGEQLQVLFVLKPQGDEASSPPADNPPE